MSQPECNDDERCVSLDVRRSHSNDYVCGEYFSLFISTPVACHLTP